MHYSINFCIIWLILCTDLCMHIIRRFIGSDRFFKTRFRSDPTERNYKLKLLPSVQNRRTSDGLPLRRGHPIGNICINHFSMTWIIMSDNIEQKSIIYETRLENHLQIVENHLKTVNNILFTNRWNHGKNKQHCENIYQNFHVI